MNVIVVTKFVINCLHRALLNIVHHFLIENVHHFFQCFIAVESFYHILIFDRTFFFSLLEKLGTIEISLSFDYLDEDNFFFFERFLFI